MHPHEYNARKKPARAKRLPRKSRPSITDCINDGSDDDGKDGGSDDDDGEDGETAAGSKSVTDVDPLAHTMASFCKLLSISESFGWKMLKDGRLNCIRIGRRTLIPHSELQRLMKAAA